jgi:hypothetical protein
MERERRRAPDGAPPEEEEEGFARFWHIWQRGHADDREGVRKAFAAAVAEHGADGILASAERWAAAREPRFLPEPVKWLAGGWQSEPAPKPKPKPKQTRPKVFHPTFGVGTVDEDYAGEPEALVHFGSGAHVVDANILEVFDGE